MRRGARRCVYECVVVGNLAVCVRQCLALSIWLCVCVNCVPVCAFDKLSQLISVSIALKHKHTHIHTQQVGQQLQRNKGAQRVEELYRLAGKLYALQGVKY